MKTNICIIFGIFYNIIWGQDLDSLRLSYIDNQQQKNNKILALTRKKKSWKWLSLVPNISLSSQYDPFRQTYKPMINIGLSLHNLSQYLQAHSRNRIEREKLAISLQDLRRFVPPRLSAGYLFPPTTPLGAGLLFLHLSETKKSV